MLNQKRALTGRIYRACRSFFEPLRQEILPLSSDSLVAPTQQIHITGRVQPHSFWPKRLTISNGSTPGGAADWIINDLKIAGRSQFKQSGDVPGDLFASEVVNGFLLFDLAKTGTEIEISATYIGTNEKGCAFYSSITGLEYDPGLLGIVREALSQALAS